jgi:hypothetical protein
MQNHHIRIDKFIHPNSILLFANRRNQSWNFPFYK